jgi:hypothetical protein
VRCSEIVCEQFAVGVLKEFRSRPAHSDIAEQLALPGIAA